MTESPRINGERHIEGTQTAAQRMGVTLFLCGDVMTGRGVDQILPHASPPRIFESYVQDAREYVEMAESANGRIPRPVSPSYIWGDALAELARVQPAARIVNLETSVTRCDDYWKGKGINYRMHPENVACLTAARLDVCVLANNHVLDYGRRGLVETLDTLAHAGLETAGAGRNLAQALKPAIVSLADGARLLVFAVGTESSGIPSSWVAGTGTSGIALLPDLSRKTAADLVARVEAVKRPNDLVVASIHWGTNWGYEVTREQERFAHWLIEGGVHIVHGHSSHHPRPIEVYRGRLVLYGSGDFINDYEGIAGYEPYRSDLTLMYFATMETTGDLTALSMVPMQLRQLRLCRASLSDAQWLRDSLARASAPFGSEIDLEPDGRLRLRRS